MRRLFCLMFGTALLLVESGIADAAPKAKPRGRASPPPSLPISPSPPQTLSIPYIPPPIGTALPAMSEKQMTPPPEKPAVTGPRVPGPGRFDGGWFVFLANDGASRQYFRLPEKDQRGAVTQAWVLSFPVSLQAFDAERYTARLYDFDCAERRMRLRIVAHVDDMDYYLSSEVFEGDWTPVEAGSSGPDRLRLACSNRKPDGRLEGLTAVRIDEGKRALAETP